MAVLTLGLTGPAYQAGELRQYARTMRDNLLKVPGVERVSLHGVRDEQVQIVLDVAAMAAKGLSPSAVERAVASRNVVAAAGFMDIAGTEISLTVSGDARTPLTWAPPRLRYPRAARCCSRTLRASSAHRKTRRCLARLWMARLRP